ncbi:MAG TPA: YebC/PmpR family DNA-binding transcriptional regulator [Anaerolineales bacterium]|nr:YebC/PmpR family DNA-binding transcriptional regulator [Anaerolineales bacterium]
MSGHSHWATIRRKKGAADAKKGQVFTRVAKEIVLAARSGGDPALNFRLALAMEKARAVNMPKDSIERAVKRGTGEDKDGASFEELTLEGYGPNGSAIMVECVTDNRNRTVADLRHMFNKNNGSLAEPGAVAWQFDRLCYFSFPSSQLSFDAAFELGIESGAEDVTEEDGMIEMTGPVEAFKMLGDALRSKKVTPEEGGLRLQARNEIELEFDQTMQFLKVIEAIEDLDDVQDVYHNVKLSDEVLASLEEE